MHRIRRTGHRLLTVGLIFGLYLSISPLAPAVAARTASVSVTPATVPLGGAVGVSAAGFAANEPITVSISGLGVALGMLTAQSDGVVASSQITVPATLTVGNTVMPLAPGPHTLTLLGASSALTATAPLTVIASATARPATLPLGGTVTVAGAGFMPGEQVSVTIDGLPNPLTTLMADVDGLLPATQLTIPATMTSGTATSALAPGAHTLTLTGATSARSASTPVTLEPSAAVTPNTLAAGGQVAISGAGFAANEQISVALSGTASPLATLTADGNGVVSSSPVTIPVTAPLGAQTLTLTGARSQRNASAAITLTAPAAATLAVTPGAVTQGGLVTVSGSGFAPNEAVSIGVSGLNAPLTTLTATAQGQLPPTGVTIPFTLSLGAQTLQATGASSGRTAMTGITVVSVDPIIRASTAALRPGDIVTITGQGFAPRERVTFALNGVALPDAPSIVTTDDGTFVAAITIPSGIVRGPNTISAIGAESRVNAAFVARGILPVATTLYFAGVAPDLGGAAALTPASGVYWRLLVAMNLRPAPSRSPTSQLLVPAGTTVKEWGPQPSLRWIHITWQGHDGYLLAGNMLPRGVQLPTMHPSETLDVLNANAEPARVTLTFYGQSGSSRRVRLVVAAHSRYTTASLTALAGTNDVLGLTLSADRAISAQLHIWRGGQDGGALHGVTAPATAWYLPAVSAGANAQQALTLVNPEPQPSRVLLRLLAGTGRVARLVTVVLPPRAGRVVDVTALTHARLVSVIATASQPIVLARTTAFGPTGNEIMAQVGANTPATSWVFAHGQMVSGARASLSILNPNAQGAFVTVSVYARSGGIVATRTVYVRGLAHAMLLLPDDPAVRDGGLVVTGDRPVVVARSTYAGNAGDAVVASDVFGYNGAGVQWDFSGGDTGVGRELLAVFNPSPHTATIEATFYGSNGVMSTLSLTLPPTQQSVVDVTARGLAPTPRYGVTLRATNGVGFVAEQTLAGTGDAPWSTGG